MPKQMRTEKIEVRLTPEEKNIIQLAAEMRDTSMSDFVRHMAVEMGRAIAQKKSPKETYYAVIMGAGRNAPEVSMYAATADTADMAEYTSMSGRKEGNDEGENET